MGNKIFKQNIPSPEDIVKQQYFILISQTFHYHHHIINNYKLNTELSFKKKFLCDNEDSRNKKLKMKIYWKTYLINFFRKRINKGHEFYSDIINDINKERFGFENKYLSFMFYIDFEKEYDSNITDIYFKKYLKEKEKDPETKLKSRLSRYSNADLASSGQRRTKSIINLPNVPDEQKEEKNYTHDQNIKRKQVINLVEIIKEQIEKKDHPINIVISIFEKQISSTIDYMINSYKINFDSNKKEFLENIKNLNLSIISNINKFTKKIYVATKLFYSRVIHLDCFMEEKDELINIIMGILFNTGSLWNKINYMFKIQYNDQYEDFNNKLFAMKKMKPKDIQIDDKFCLDENTDLLISELKKKYELNLKDSVNLNEDKGIYSDIFNSTKKVTFIKKDKYYRFNSAIDIIKNELPKKKSPYAKMTLIALLSTEINECINNYWDGLDDIIPTDNYLEINCDELLKIFIYVIVCSQSPELLIHQQIIKKFTFKLTNQSMIGFYNRTLDAAISYIQENLLNDVKIGITKEFRNSIIENLTLKDKLNIDYDMPNIGNSKLHESIDEDYILFDGFKNEVTKQEIGTFSTFNIANSFNDNLNNNKNSSMFNFFKGNNK